MAIFIHLTYRGTSKTRNWGGDFFLGKVLGESPYSFCGGELLMEAAPPKGEWKEKESIPCLKRDCDREGPKMF